MIDVLFMEELCFFRMIDTHGTFSYIFQPAMEPCWRIRRLYIYIHIIYIYIHIFNLFYILYDMIYILYYNIHPEVIYDQFNDPLGNLLMGIEPSIPSIHQPALSVFFLLPFLAFVIFFASWKALWSSLFGAFSATICHDLLFLIAMSTCTMILF